MSTYGTLLKKDLLLEARGKHFVVAFLALALILCVLAALGLGAYSFPYSVERSLYPLLGWLISLVTMSVSFSKLHDYDVEESALDGLLLSGVDTGIMFLAKFSACALLGFAGHLFVFLLLGVLLNIELASLLPPLLALSLPVICALSALATMLSALTTTAKLQALLTPILFLPLAAPLFLAAHQLSVQIMDGLSLEVGSPLLSLIAALLVVYVLLGFNLYGSAIRG